MPKWLKLAIGVAGLLLLISRGGLQLLGPLLKFMLPAVAGYLVYKNAKQYFLRDQTSGSDDHEPENIDEPIRICPNCGRDIRICGGCDGSKTS